jgi:hypothetical protein
MKRFKEALLVPNVRCDGKRIGIARCNNFLVNHLAAWEPEIRKYPPIMVPLLHVVFDSNGGSAGKEVSGIECGGFALLNNGEYILMIARGLLFRARIRMTLGGVDADQAHSLSITCYLEHDRIPI